MAVKLSNSYNPEDSDTLLYVKTEKNGLVSYRGYKKVYLAQELSALEGDFLTCSKCLGIPRDAVSSGGDTLCELCREENSAANPALKVRNSVAELKIICPLLRDCGWKGKILEGEEHLKECESSFIACPLECGDVIERCEADSHIKTDCPLREVKCEFCNITLALNNISEHLVTCPAYPIVCKCNEEFRRDEFKKHVDTDCELTEIECPYAKYSCKIGKILRKDLLAHKKEFYIEHQDMIERGLVEEVGQLRLDYNQLKEKHKNIEEQYVKLEQGLKFSKTLARVTVNLNLHQSWDQNSFDFDNGVYKFTCKAMIYKGVKIMLKRLLTSSYSDKNILFITDCVLRLHETTTEKEPYIVYGRVSSKIEPGQSVYAMTLSEDIFLRYSQSNGTVIMEVYFDYEYATYKGIF